MVNIITRSTSRQVPSALSLSISLSLAFSRPLSTSPYPPNSRLEFEGQRGRLVAQLEYEEEQAEQQQMKLSQLEETVAEEKLTVAQQAKVDTHQLSYWV